MRVDMRKTIFMVITISFLVSCGNKKERVAAAEEPAMETVDSIGLPMDTLLVEEELSVEKPLPPVDEYFDDFIFSFAQDGEFQSKRILFPLPYHTKDTVLKLKAEEWEYDSLLLSSVYYTVILDSEEELDQMGDISITSAQVEWAYLESRFIKKFFFEKIDNKWMLEGVSIYNFDEQQKNDFYSFYHQFVTDSVFQEQHISNPLEFVTTDPDDDFDVLEATLDVNQWFAFKPELPEKWLTNIIYGREHVNGNSKQKVLQLKGVGNGFVNTLFFRQRRGQWELYKYEDINN